MSRVKTEQKSKMHKNGEWILTAQDNELPPAPPCSPQMREQETNIPDLVGINYEINNNKFENCWRDRLKSPSPNNINEYI